MNINLIFLTKNSILKKRLIIFSYNNTIALNTISNIHFFKTSLYFLKKKVLKTKFLKKTLTFVKTLKPLKLKKKKFFFLFLNRFFISFLEDFFKSKFLLNIKKGTNKLLLKQIGFRKFTIKYFKRRLRVGKQIIGILYYTFLLKDVTIFTNFFKRIVERVNLKLHKKIFLGLKKLIKDLFKPLFNFLGLQGVFFNIKGKIGVSGSSKKRRYFFHFGKHSITKRTLKIDLKNIPL